MNELEALAERVEKATGADRELDRLIDLAAGHDRPFGLRYAKGPNFSFMEGQCVSDVSDQPAWEVGNWFRIPAYTASLDAAMSIYVTMPEFVPSDPRKATADALRQRAGL